MKSVAIVFSFLIISTLLFSQIVVDLPADRDNTMYEESVNESNGMGDFFFTGINDNDEIRRSLLRFDLSSIPSNAIVSNVQLTLFCSRSLGTFVVNVHKLNNDWGEGNSHAPGQEGGGAAAQAGDATWGFRFWNTDAWAVNGGDFDATISSTTTASNGAFSTFTGATLIADVQGWISSSANNFGWLLKGPETNSGEASRFNSRQNASNQPSLQVTYTVPDPCTGVDSTMLSGVLNSILYQFPDSSLVTDGIVLADSVVGLEAINFIELLPEFEVQLAGELEVTALPCE